jgi:CHAD domain-containing protein
MAELHAMRTDLRKVLAKSEDHEKRLESLESLKHSYRELIECNDAVIRDLNVLKEQQESLVQTVGKHVEGALRGDLLDLRRELRTEMAKIIMSNGALTEAQQQLTTLLLDRPCVSGGDGNCIVEDPK